MSAYTPGPWVVRQPVPSPSPAFLVVGADKTPAASVFVRADCAGGANARLIAAAPEMANLLRRVVAPFAITDKAELTSDSTLLADIRAALRAAGVA